MPGNEPYRERMRDECVRMHNILRTRRRVGVAALADELGIHPKTVRRWVISFSFIMPVRIINGIVEVGDEIL